MKKIYIALFLLTPLHLFSITSNITHRVMGTSPLLYKMIDYSKYQISFEAEPIFMSLYENKQVISSIMPFGKKTLNFDQQGKGDLNPIWMNLMSSNDLANYNSQVTFNPSLTQSGMLLHWYDNFEHMFIDIKTALVQCKSEVEITEIGGGNGLVPGILNAQQAFTQPSWNYGKIGQANHVVGLDNIEVRFGGVTKATSHASTYDLFITGFGIIEAPTGTGTKAEWLFEPQVGTNHWGIGAGFEALVCGHYDLKFMIAGNYRYLTPNWETRSFDLLDNGPWSRYLGVQDSYGLPTAPATLALPGINFFTQQAYIRGRSELNLYARLSKQILSSYLELSYNFFCLEKESIGAIKNPTPGYGIYALTGPAGGSGGVTTASKATINEDVTNFDPIGSPVTFSSENFNKQSAAQGTYATNMLAARLEINRNNIVYGFGAAVESGLSQNALSTWSVWAKFEYLFDNIKSCNYTHEDTLPLYTVDTHIGAIEYNLTDIDTSLPEEITQQPEYDVIENNINDEESIETSDEQAFFITDTTNVDEQESFDDQNNFEENNTIFEDENSIKNEQEESQAEIEFEDGCENEILEENNEPHEIIAIDLDENHPILSSNHNGLQIHDQQNKQTLKLDDHETQIIHHNGIQLSNEEEEEQINPVENNIQTIEPVTEQQAQTGIIIEQPTPLQAPIELTVQPEPAHENLPILEETGLILEQNQNEISPVQELSEEELLTQLDSSK